MTASEGFRLDDSSDTLMLHLDRPPVNAIDLGVVRSLAAAMERITALPPSRPLVITGKGARFSAGLDLKTVPHYGRAEQREMIETINRLVGMLYGMPRPIVAAVNGHALAAGLVVALMCDYRISTSAPCRFGLPEIKVGIPYPAGPMCVVQHELPPSTARLLVLCGQTFDPAAALAHGIVDELVAPERVVPRAIEMATAMAAFPNYDRIKTQFRAPAIAELQRIVEARSDPMLAGWI